MPWTVADSAVAPDRQIGERGQLPIFEAVKLECAGVLCLGGLRSVAASHHDDGAIARHRQNLVGEDAEVQLRFLRDVRADRSIAVNAVDGEVAWVVVTGEGEIAAGINAVVDGS